MGARLRNTENAMKLYSNCPFPLTYKFFYFPPGEKIPQRSIYTELLTAPAFLIVEKPECSSVENGKKKKIKKLKKVHLYYEILCTSAPWKESSDRPGQRIQKQRHHFAEEGLSSQSYGFSSGHVLM